MKFKIKFIQTTTVKIHVFYTYSYCELIPLSGRYDLPVGIIVLHKSLFILNLCSFDKRPMHYRVLISLESAKYYPKPVPVTAVLKCIPANKIINYNVKSMKLSKIIICVYFNKNNLKQIRIKLF